MLKNIFAVLVLFYLISVYLNCQTSSEPLETKGTIKGSVKVASTGETGSIHPAYIFSRDSLLVKTDNYGNYTILSLEQGTHNLTCSALNYRDTTQQVQVFGGETVTKNFYLQPDSSIGRVYGEFQDMTLFRDSLATNPSLQDWEPLQIFNGVTGATLQAKTLRYEVPYRKVFLGDSLVAISDGYAQYWFEIQCGTYLLTGTCEGYRDASKVVTVLPGKKQYVNFFLYREAGNKAKKTILAGN